MKKIQFWAIGFLMGSIGCAAAASPLPVLKHSDVIFMYQASPEIYREYGATVLAWGGKPRSGASEYPIKRFGSVGMVTEFSAYYERFPTQYQDGLCRDLEGKPYKVPWLTDHNHKGVPYYWCCTRQPLFRQFIEERVEATVKAGADGVHIDDHLGTAGSIFLGGCFCDRCVAEFPAYLKAQGGVEVAPQPAANDFRTELRKWLSEQPGRKPTQHPLWETWRVYQFRGAAAFMAHLRSLAAEEAGQPVPFSANACLLWGPHLSDHESVDFFSAEIDHHAAARKLSLAPVVAYRIADAVGRPLASTASGGDWAFVKEQGTHGLVRSWIALGYASGHSLMAPNRQWCHTAEKGTHWYEGPREVFAPLYRFARAQAAWLDGYRNHAEVLIVYSQRTYDRDSGILVRACEALAARHISFGVALIGDEIVRRPFPEAEIARAKMVLALEEKDWTAAEREKFTAAIRGQRFKTTEEAVATVKPGASAAAHFSALRIFPRVAEKRAVVHLVNWQYESERDGVRPLGNVKVDLDTAALGVGNCRRARWIAPGAEVKELPVRESAVIIPEMELWGMLVLEAGEDRP